MDIANKETPPSERRRPTFSQRYSVAVDTAMILAMISAILWVGQKTKTIDTVDETMKVQVSKLDTISGQMTQMASVSAMAQISQRVSVLETQTQINDQTSREFRDDLKTRLTRIETKIDRDVRR